MIYVKLIGHNFRHEVRELIKVFFLEKEILFIDDREEYCEDGILIENTIIQKGHETNSITKIYSNDKLFFKHNEKTLEEIEKLNPENVTVHTLAIKRGSRFKETMDKYPIEDQSIIEDMLNETRKFAQKMELNSYYLYRQKQILGNFENIGYAKKDKECMYNIKMMEEKETVMAAGMGSVSKIFFPKENRIERVPNVKSIEEYFKRIDEMIERKVKVLNY